MAECKFFEKNSYKKGFSACSNGFPDATHVDASNKAVFKYDLMNRFLSVAAFAGKSAVSVKSLTRPFLIVTILGCFQIFDVGWFLRTNVK